jgi:hypothetical protein
MIEATDAGFAKTLKGQVIKIKLEVDTQPPPRFATEMRYLLQPVPFPVRIYILPDLFAGKMHAVLCRRWKNRVKGRDWYDFVWYVTNAPILHLGHLEQRMRQSGHWVGEAELSQETVLNLIHEAIDRLDVEQARKEVEVFVREPQRLSVWSHAFFRDITRRIQFS